jgi:uncharacterized protein with HEPN domain
VPRDEEVFLEDILHACARIQRYTVGVTLEDLWNDEKTVDAVVRNLEIIGEAAKSVTPLTRDAIAEVEWKRLAGLRDILIHEYFGVDIEIIWDIVQTRLPDLIGAISHYLGADKAP